MQNMAMPKHTKVIDIEETIIGWAKEVFKITRSKEQARIKDDDLAYTVNWSRARIVHSEPEYSDKKQPVAPNSQVLFKTTFTNNTDHQQEYSFKTERTTSSTCDVCIEKGVSYGAELGLTLKLPGDVLEVGTGFKKELSVNKTVGETFSEELTWGVDSLVKVPAKTITTAELVISEQQNASSFTVKTRVSGKILVHITHLSDNNSFVKSIDGELVEIWKRQAGNSDSSTVVVEKHCLSYITKGQCHFRFGVEQHVNISEKAIDAAN